MMKKFTFIIIAFVFSISFVNAQSYTLSWEGETLGDTVVIGGDPADAELIFHAILTNNSDDSVAFKLQRRFIHLLDGVTHYLCWGLCYLPNHDSIFVSPGYVGLNAGQSSSEFDFSGHYEPTGVIGTSLIEYTFFNVDNEDEYVTIVAKFVTSPDGIIDQIMADGFVSDIYPNPATNFINFDYKMTAQVNSAQIRLVNILGSVIKSIELEENATNLRMDISDLNSGIYFYSVIINNEVYRTKKLIVK